MSEVTVAAIQSVAIVLLATIESHGLAPVVVIVL